MDLKDPFVTSAVEAAKCRHVAISDRSSAQDKAFIVSIGFYPCNDWDLNSSVTNSGYSWVGDGAAL